MLLLSFVLSAPQRAEALFAYGFVACLEMKFYGNNFLNFSRGIIFSGANRQRKHSKIAKRATKYSFGQI